MSKRITICDDQGFLSFRPEEAKCYGTAYVAPDWPTDFEKLYRTPGGHWVLYWSGERFGEDGGARRLDDGKALAWLDEWILHGRRDWPEELRGLVAQLQAKVAGKSKKAKSPTALENGNLSGQGQPGRPGYPVKALRHAQMLRRKHPTMKAHQIRIRCLEKFSADDLPPDGESFRRWLNRHRANRAK